MTFQSISVSPSGLEGEVEMDVETGSLRIRPVKKPRAGWVEALRQMGTQGDDALLDDLPVALSSWDEDEWDWS